MAAGGWHYWIDRGGTFTDIVALDPQGRLHRTKLLSEDPARYADAAIAGIRRITGAAEGPLPAGALRLGTTIATNALLERTGEPVLLAITAGLGDALAIGTQERPDIFARCIHKPSPLYAAVAEIAERIGAEGEVLAPLDEAQARATLAAARAAGLRAIAIVLMHGWNHPAHELRLAELARDAGFTQVSVSHQVAPLIKLIARGETAVADAYLSPVLERYVGAFERGLGPVVSALYMQSNGGLTAGSAFHGKDAVLSGPAGGIVGMAAVARAAGIAEAVGFDMGGTSTDVSWFSGGYERDSENRIAGTRIRAPMLRIHTVAAGGGSICRFDGVRLSVGPASAGAQPGPACYRRGGPLTVTDCNLALGKLRPEFFPAIFGSSGDQPLALAAAQARLRDLAGELGKSGQHYTPEAAAEGCLTIAVANMANAIKAISIRRGHDLTRAALVSFGGAGGQHACLVAEALGISQVLCHPLASVLSAYGMGLADRRAVREATLALPLDADHEAALEAALAEHGAAVAGELAAQTADPVRLAASLFVRPQGSASSIPVSPARPVEMQAEFAAAWQKRFGFAASGPLVAESLRIEAIADCAAPPLPLALPAGSAPPVTEGVVYCRGSWRQAPIFRREMLAAGFAVSGPALVVDDVSTIVIEPGWTGRIDGAANLLLEHTESFAAAQAGTARDPVKLEVMGALFMAIAEEMGAALQASAASVNIRERLDFSCALFDGAGNLIANAPHMPVHLGSMGESVRTIIRRRANDGRGLCQGDAYALNAPYEGGTHLPDITVVMPVFAAPEDLVPAWFVAARGHHADIGGIAPGSMPPTSRSVMEEGILLDNLLLVDRGELREAQLRALLSEGRWPARNPERNLADLKAQLAACAKGAAELRALAGRAGRAVVDAYMGHVQDQAEQAVRSLLAGLVDGSFTAPMDNGAQVAVAVSIDREAGAAVIDFTGSSAQLADNFNAPLPVVRAAVLYALRTMLDEPVPLNEGCLRPIQLVVPAGSMLNPAHPAAVVAGNVETSQVITDALFAAFGALAAAQGTMNNFTFGDAQHQYYETIAGGAGAGPDCAGADAVQTHMTNSRLTDPEILEHNFPVLLEKFAIRRGSGGDGQHRGGDGIVRRIRFRSAMMAGILSGRRLTEPFGLAGGEAGARGENRVLRADGRVEELGPWAQVAMEPGDAFEIRTPGGGGFGKPVK